MSASTGAATLMRLALRRDRVVLPVWLAVFLLSAAGSAATVSATYPTAASRLQAAAAVNASVPLVALYGPLYEPASLGALALWKLGAVGAALVGVLTMLTVARHTRAEEDDGRAELLGSAVVGRAAPLAAGLAVASGAAVVLGAAVAAVLVATGLPAAGSVAFGAAWASCGLVFAGVGAVAAQLCRSARVARGLATVVLVTAFALRAAADVAAPAGPAWLTWLSPVGWSQQVRPFAGDRWAVLLLPLAATVALAVATHRLRARRDLGAGLFADRPGPAVARRDLAGPLGLAWRLHRGVLVAWAAGFALFPALLGGLATDVAVLLASPQMQEIVARLGGRQGLVDAFLAAEFGLLAVFASVFAVQAAMRLRAEEQALLAETVLATATGRLRWASGHLAAAGLGSALLLAVAGAAAGTAHGLRTGELAEQLPRLLGAALAHLPAVWVVAAATVAVFGIAPRLVPAVWVLFAGIVLVGELGPLLRLRPVVMDLSPFTHVPRLPGAPVVAAPLLWLLAVAAALLVAGLAGFRRRDVG